MKHFESPLNLLRLSFDFPGNIILILLPPDPLPEAPPGLPRQGVQPRVETLSRQHYSLVAGEVSFITKEGENGITRINVVLTAEDKNITAKRMGNAQEAIIARFFQVMGSQDFNIKDVFIIGISYLGFMAPKEFSGGVSNLYDPESLLRAH